MSDRIEDGESASDAESPKDMEEYTKALLQQMAPLKVEAANRDGDREALQAAVQNYEAIGLKDSPQAQHARDLLDCVIRYEKELTDACEQRDRQRIVKSLEEIRKGDHRFARTMETSSSDPRKPRVGMYLRKLIETSERLADELAVTELPPPIILAMDKKTMTELKSYVKPAPMVHRVMQAVFLLFREDEEKTASWAYCQKLCLPDGPNGLNRKLMKFKPEKVDPFVAQRVQHLLKDIDLRTVQMASPGAATFFVWATNIVSSRSGQESDQASVNTSAAAAAGHRLTHEERVKRERAAFKKLIQKEKDIFRRQEQEDAGDTLTETSVRSQRKTQKSQYYNLLY